MLKLFKLFYKTTKFQKIEILYLKTDDYSEKEVT